MSPQVTHVLNTEACNPWIASVVLVCSVSLPETQMVSSKQTAMSPVTAPDAGILLQHADICVFGQHATVHQLPDHAVSITKCTLIVCWCVSFQGITSYKWSSCGTQQPLNLCSIHGGCLEPSYS